MKLAVRRWAKNKNSASIDLGPLTFALQIGEKWTRCGGTDAWPEQSVTPTSPWNYGLVLYSADPAASIQIMRANGPLADQPFTSATTPIHLEAKAKRIEGWTTDRNELLRPLQESPAASSAPVETVTLIPMGAARLRISQFPVIGDGPDAHQWIASPRPTGLSAEGRPSASFVFNDINALNSGETPKSSADQSISRFTWWNHLGTTEWVQYDFKSPTAVSSCQVYWFDDTGDGRCRVPASWRILYRDGNDWKPVEGLTDYPTKANQANQVSFTRVQTPALRLEVQLQPMFSGGILQWVVN